MEGCGVSRGEKDRWVEYGVPGRGMSHGQLQDYVAEFYAELEWLGGTPPTADAMRLPPTEMSTAIKMLRESLKGSPNEIWPEVSSEITSGNGLADLVSWLQDNDRDAFRRVQSRVQAMDSSRKQKFSSKTNASSEIIDKLMSSSDEEAAHSELREQVLRSVLARQQWLDFLDKREGERTQFALAELGGTSWSSELTRMFNDPTKNFYDAAKRPLMFEIRFAYELNRAGITPDYEYRSGVGGSSIDFRLPGKPDWLIELWSPAITDSVREATNVREHRGIQTMSLEVDEDLETRKLQTKVIGKVFDHLKGCPIKFPKPSGAIHALLVDVRQYLHGGDCNDYIEIAYGVPIRFRLRAGGPMVEIGRNVEGRPLIGLFDMRHPNPGAAVLQERIHFVGFVAERRYADKEMLEETYFCANNHLFATKAEAAESFATCPLKFSRPPLFHPSE